MTKIWKIRIFQILNYSLVLNTCIVNLFKTTSLNGFYILNKLKKIIAKIGCIFRLELFMWLWSYMSRPWAFLSVRSGHPWLRWSKPVSGKTVDYARRWEMPWYIHVISVAHYFFALHQIDIQSLKRASLILLHQNREIHIFCTDQPKNLNGFLF